MGLVSAAGASRQTWLANRIAVSQTRTLLIVTSITAPVAALMVLGSMYASRLRDTVLQRCHSVACGALAWLSLVLFISGRWMLGGLLAVLAIADTIWYLRSSDRLEFVRVRWLSQACPTLVQRSFCFFGSRSWLISSRSCQVLFGISVSSLKQHPKVPQLVIQAVLLQTGYSVLWSLIGWLRRTALHRKVDCIELTFPLLPHLLMKCGTRSGGRPSCWVWSDRGCCIPGCHAVQLSMDHHGTLERRLKTHACTQMCGLWRRTPVVAFVRAHPYGQSSLARLTRSPCNVRLVSCRCR